MCTIRRKDPFLDEFSVRNNAGRAWSDDIPRDCGFLRRIVDRGQPVPCAVGPVITKRVPSPLFIGVNDETVLDLTAILNGDVQRIDVRPVCKGKRNVDQAGLSKKLHWSVINPYRVDFQVDEVQSKMIDCFKSANDDEGAAADRTTGIRELKGKCVVQGIDATLQRRILTAKATGEYQRKIY